MSEAQITVRELIAAMMLQGILSSGAGGERTLKVMSAVNFADALLSELNANELNTKPPEVQAYE